MGSLTNESSTPGGNSGSADITVIARLETAEPCAELAEFPAFKTDPPTPLPERGKYPTYPLEALGPFLGPAAERIAYYVQSPPALAGQSVLAAAALATQSRYDVIRGNIGRSPTSLYCISIAESGDRKSAVDKLALKPIRELEHERNEASTAEWKEYRVQKEAWDAHKKAIEKESKSSNSGSFTEADRVRLAKALSELESSRPKAPLRPNILFSEPTSEGIWRHFEEGLPTAGLFSDEGIGFFGGHGMTKENQGRMIALLSHLWGGDTLTRTRAAQGESGVLMGRCLTTHLMMQPVVSNLVFSDPLFVGQGFIPRFLTSIDVSRAGTRLLSDRPIGECAHDDPNIQKYWAILTKMIQKPLNIDLNTGALQVRTLEIQGGAFEVWRNAFDQIERESAPNGRYADIRAYASKAGENIARIAAVLSAVEGGGPVTETHVANAVTLMMYYLEVILVMTEASLDDQEALDAEQLLKWIQANETKITAQDFKRLPTKIRNAKTARRLLKLLVEYGYLEVTKKNARSNQPSEWVVIDHD